MFLFEKEYKKYEYFDYLIVTTYIRLVRLMKLADHKSQLVYTFQCMNRHIAGLSMFKLQIQLQLINFPLNRRLIDAANF